MPQYTKSVPKNPASSDETLEVMLEFIILQNENGGELIGYQNKPDKILLTFDRAE